MWSLPPLRNHLSYNVWLLVVNKSQSLTKPRWAALHFGVFSIHTSNYEFFSYFFHDTGGRSTVTRGLVHKWRKLKENSAFPSTCQQHHPVWQVSAFLPISGGQERNLVGSKYLTPGHPFLCPEQWGRRPWMILACSSTNQGAASMSAAQ